MPSDLDQLVGLGMLMDFLDTERSIYLWQRASFSADEMKFYMREGRIRSNSHVKKLAEYLDNVSKGKQEVMESVMYADLIWPGFDDMRGKTTSDVYLHINLLAKDLRCFEELSRERQEELMNTCSRLSQLAHPNRNRYWFGLAA